MKRAAIVLALLFIAGLIPEVSANDDSIPTCGQISPLIDLDVSSHHDADETSRPLKAQGENITLQGFRAIIQCSQIINLNIVDSNGTVANSYKMYKSSATLVLAPTQLLNCSHPLNGIVEITAINHLGKFSAVFVKSYSNSPKACGVVNSLQECIISVNLVREIHYIPMGGSTHRMVVPFLNLVHSNNGDSVELTVTVDRNGVVNSLTYVGAI